MSKDEHIVANIISGNPDVDAAMIEAASIVLARRTGRQIENNEDFRRGSRAASIFSNALHALSEQPLVFKSCRSKIEGPQL